jgi:hypothetical protein
MLRSVLLGVAGVIALAVIFLLVSLVILEFPGP